MSGFGTQIVQFVPGKLAATKEAVPGTPTPAVTPAGVAGLPVVGLMPITLGNWYMPS